MRYLEKLVIVTESGDWHDMADNDEEGRAWIRRSMDLYNKYPYTGMKNAVEVWTYPILPTGGHGKPTKRPANLDAA